VLVSEAATLTDAVTEVERLQQTGTITQEQDLGAAHTNTMAWQRKRLWHLFADGGSRSAFSIRTIAKPFL
jgi:hypothetical protein